MKKTFDRTDLPERLQYTKYYEHDGMLRAYANRAMVLAMFFAVIAVASLGFAIYVRLQPPIVVRVDAEGYATAAAQTGMNVPSLAAVAVQAAADPGPTELEAKAVIRRFLENYLAYTPATVEQNFAAALNMMTSNLRTYSLGKLRDDNTVGTIKEDRITSQLRIRTIEPIKNAPWTLMGFV